MTPMPHCRSGSSELEAEHRDDLTIMRSSVTGLPVRTPTRFSRRLLAMITWYQRGAEGRPSPCRFFPSCSSYAHEAIEVHGSVRGGWLAARRLLRCRPLGPSGVDLVPPPAESCRSQDGSGVVAMARHPHPSETSSSGT